MKKILTMFAATTVALSSLVVPTMAADKEVTVEFNGTYVELEQAPIIESGRVLVPFRFVAEKLGADVEWDAETKTVTCTKDGVSMNVTADNDELVVSGSSIKIDVPAKIVNSRFMVPLRTIASGFGAELVWNNDTKTVSINTKKEDVAATTEETTVADTTEATTVEGTTEATTAAAKDDFSYEMETISDNSLNAVASYPVFNGKFGDAVNAPIATFMKDEIDAFVGKVTEAAKENTDADIKTFEYKLDTEVVDSKDFVSVIVTEYEFTGGAHGSTTVNSSVFNKKDYDLIAASDADYNKAIAQFKEMGKDEANNFFEDADASLTAENINYYVNKDGEKVFYLNDSIVAPHVQGLVSTIVK